MGTNLDTTIGNLGLTDEEMQDIRDFLGALTDVGVQLAGDISADGRVEVVDLLYLVDAFNTVTGDPKYSMACDLNINGAVGLVDLLVLAGNIGM